MHTAAIRGLPVLLICAVATVNAQDPQPTPLPREPIAAFVADARLGWPGFKKDASVAESLDVNADDLPGRGLGLILGAQVFAARSKAVALGIGGEMLWARAGRTAEPADEGDPPGPPLKNRWSNISPQVSLNFGKKDGWSYLTGGIGWSKLTIEREDDPQESGSRVRSINYGGGARWFVSKHVALNLDLRFYSIGAQGGTTSRIAIPKMRLLVFSGGMSIR